MQRNVCMLTLSALFLILSGLLPQQANAGAWAKKKGEYYAKLSSISYSADEHFTADGKREPLSTPDDSFDADQVFLYVEYGVMERLTLVADGNWGELVNRSMQVRDANSGVGDLGIGAKYQWLDAPVVLAPYIKLKIPTGYDSDDNPSLGTGDVDLEFQLLASRSLYPWPVYVGAELGYRLRGSGESVGAGSSLGFGVSISR